ncbi:serine hydrolase domain-containing protein [Mesonia maritima]|uniref:CubicO group peptidase (Beta-lactamase class C family) n=1 Tax=Mesonia maritima TaxID=1793873 RepID=A0ABU1K4P0_9FLAO|nr:serine hydrolase domain-containing protein [Mesonia maritima]MDR6300578.1 CubicO group peptidase (beta-lactamase class C family) [Mesonia maritima]
MKKLLFALFVLLQVNPLFSQNFNKEKMDSLFQAIAEKDKAMLSISLAENGKEIYSKSIGYASLENHQKADKKTMYRIGSISKSFTAVIILQLIEEGKLQLDAKLSEFYPDLPNASNITIKNLLNHHSGLFNFTDKEDYLEMSRSKKSKKQLLKLIEKNGSIFKPGSDAQYSNTNFILLTFIAEDVSEKSFKTLVKQRIIEPLQLKRTRFGGEINLQNNEAASYTPEGKNWQIEEETHMSIPLGAGAMVSTPSDLVKFYIELFEGNLLTPSSLEKMQTIEDGYGLGLFEFPFYNKSSYGHSGGIDGFSSMAAYFPKENLAFAVTSNGTSISLNDVVIGVLSIYFGKDYEIPEYKETIKVDTEILEKYVGTYGSSNFPLDLTFQLHKGTLFCKATGQQEFPLSPISKTMFEFSPAGLTIEFIPQQEKLIFKQNAMQAELNRK